MAGLPKSIIKKYGVTKKAWAVFRGARKSHSRSRKASASTRGGTVAKKKFKRSRSRSGLKGFGGDFGVMLGAAAYGAGRNYVSDKIAPYTQKLGVFGDLSDEAAMLGLSYLLWKRKIPVISKFKMASDIGHAGVVIECARIGAYAAAGMMPGTTTTSSRETVTVFQ